MHNGCRADKVIAGLGSRSTLAIGRWKKYEPYLKPLLNELGPLVREYEEELDGLSLER